jgi:hypothetical protein
MSAVESEVVAEVEADAEAEAVDRGDVIADSATEAEAVEDRGDTVAEAEVAEAEAEVVEAEAEVAEAETEVAEAEASEAPSGQTVPWSRFRSQNLRLREAERKLAEAQEKLDSQTAATPEPAKEAVATEARDFDAEITTAEEQLAAALEDNDTTKVLEATRAIRAIERAQYNQRFEELSKADQTTQAQLADRAFEEALDSVERELPQIDPNSEQFDQIKQTLVQDLVRSYEAQGYASEDALLKAAAMAFPESEFGRSLLGLESAEKEEVAETKAPAPPRKLADKVAAAASTPPNINKAGGASSDKAGLTSEVDVAQLSDEEFDALPERTRARMRGDTVAA